MNTNPALAKTPMKFTRAEHLTAELARMTLLAASLSRNLITEPLPTCVLSDVKFAMDALDRYGAKSIKNFEMPLSHLREDIHKSTEFHEKHTTY